MPKIKINVTIKNKEDNQKYDVTSIFQEDILKYKEKNSTKVIFDYKKNILVRENNELRMEYYFDSGKKTKGLIEIKELNKKIEVEIETKKIERKNNDIEILFRIENDDFLYKIEEIK